MQLCEWGDAGSWAGLVDVLEAAAATVTGGPEGLRFAEIEEVVAAGQELADMQSKIEAEMRAALGKGGSVQAANGEWSHDGITTAEVEAALAELQAFPRIGHAGRVLVQQAKLVIKLRFALLACVRGQATTWQALTAVLESFEAAEHAETLPEVEAAMQELNDMRCATELAVENALATGRSEKVDGAWSHAELNTETLEAAISEAEAFPARMSDKARTLIHQARQVVRVRQALLECHWSEPASWTALAHVLESPEVAAHGMALAEVSSAQQEFKEMRIKTEAAVEAALRGGRSVQSEGRWSHDDVNTTAVAEALAALQSLPRMSEEGVTLERQSLFIIKLRQTLLACDWAKAATWAPLLKLLESVDAQEHSAMPEFRAAVQEFDDMRTSTEAAAAAALRNGSAERTADGSWSHKHIATAELAAALVELEGFCKLSAAGTALAREVAFVIQLREAQLVCEWSRAATWRGLADVLESAECTSTVAAALSEVAELQAARREFGEMRDATEAAVRAAMGQQRAVKTESGQWSHAQLSVQGLTAALIEMEAFPRPSVEGRALAQQAWRTIEMRAALLRCDWRKAATWAPLAELIEQNCASPSAQGAVLHPIITTPSARSEDGLGRAKSAKVLEKGAAVDLFARVSSFFDGLMGGKDKEPSPSARAPAPAPAIAPATATRMLRLPQPEEWEDMRQELAEMKEATVAEVRRAMAANRSVRIAPLPSDRRALVAGKALWDHSPIKLERLQVATDELAALPALSMVGCQEEVSALLAQARYSLRVREALLACDWRNAYSWTGLTMVLSEWRESRDRGNASLGELFEVACAWRELSEMRESNARVAVRLQAHARRRIAQRRYRTERGTSPLSKGCCGSCTVVDS